VFQIHEFSKPKVQTYQSSSLNIENLYFTKKRRKFPLFRIVKQVISNQLISKYTTARGMNSDDSDAKFD